MRDFTEEAALIWAQQHAGMYAGKPEQFGRDVEAVRRGARGAGEAGYGSTPKPMPPASGAASAAMHQELDSALEALARLRRSPHWSRPQSEMQAVGPPLRPAPALGAWHLPADWHPEAFQGRT